MKPLSEIIKRPLIAAALSPNNPSEQKQRILTLYELDMISRSEFLAITKIIGGNDG